MDNEQRQDHSDDRSSEPIEAKIPGGGGLKIPVPREAFASFKWVVLALAFFIASVGVGITVALIVWASRGV